MEGLNVVRRVSMRGGLLGLLSGESQGKALERVIPQLNRDGYRISFVIDDQWSMLKRILNIFVLVLTLGFFGFSQNVLLIGERVGPPTPGA